MNPDLPIIHLPTFEPDADSWILATAMTAVGSQYLGISSREWYATFLQRLLQRAISLKVSLNFPSTHAGNVDGEKFCEGVSSPTDISFAQSILLLQLCLLFNGKKHGIIDLQFQRDILITFIRPMLAKYGSIFKLPEVPGGRETAWKKWIVTESWLRLAYFAWCKDSWTSLLRKLTGGISI